MLNNWILLFKENNIGDIGIMIFNRIIGILNKIIQYSSIILRKIIITIRAI